eukprot:3407116-Pleurochrysis_carterae.AAC.5
MEFYERVRPLLAQSAALASLRAFRGCLLPKARRLHVLCVRRRLPATSLCRLGGVFSTKRA